MVCARGRVQASLEDKEQQVEALRGIGMAIKMLSFQMHEQRM